MFSAKYLINLGSDEFVKFHINEAQNKQRIFRFSYVNHEGAEVVFNTNNDGLLDRSDVFVLQGLKPQRVFHRSIETLKNNHGYVTIYPFTNRPKHRSIFSPIPQIDPESIAQYTTAVLKINEAILTARIAQRTEQNTNPPKMKV